MKNSHNQQFRVDKEPDSARDASTDSSPNCGSLTMQLHKLNLKQRSNVASKGLNLKTKTGNIGNILMARSDPGCGSPLIHNHKKSLQNKRGFQQRPSLF